MKLRIFEAFSGYGSQSMALERLKKEYSDFDYEVVGISEIDRYAIQAYNAVHGDDIPNFGDISKIDWNDVPDFDLFTMSSPCQDFSSAGLQKGGEEGSGTRSSLLWECRRAILAKKPKYILFENVKALTSKKFLPYLLKWQDKLYSYGYTNFTKVLNAKNYGVPQNRERVFMVSVLGDAWYEFPEPFALDKRLKDVLEKGVDEKYYLSKKLVDCFRKRTEVAIEKGNGFRFKPTDGDCIASAVTTCAGSRTDDNFIKEYQNEDPYIKQYPRGFNDGFEYKNGCSLSLTTSSWENNNLLVEPQILQVGNLVGNQEPKIIEDRLNDVCREVVPLNEDKEGLCRTIKAQYYKNAKSNFEREGSMAATGATDGYRIRKLTPRECFRLMGVSDSDIDKIQSAGISKTQQYKLAGNSIVVDVLYYIFANLFINKTDK